jgi:NADPH:quinone reductase-like Zn-dependent oxidoreductase
VRQCKAWHRNESHLTLTAPVHFSLSGQTVLITGGSTGFGFWRKEALKNLP